MSAQQVSSDIGDARPPGTETAAFTPEQIAVMVVEARERIVRTASRHSRFEGLSADDVEELFDATSEIVLRRHETFASDDHVRASLWHGMELRARDVFRRRRRRGTELDPEILDELSVDLGDHEDRIARDQTLLVVQDFLAALTPREAEVWKLAHGEELSVLATSKRLGISRHAVGEHLEAATRKLTTFAALAEAGQWCGRRQADIDRVLAGADEEGTLRRAMAHLEACADCRRANARRVREAGGIAAGVLPMPALLVATGGRGVLERVLDLLPQLGGGGGRTEAMAGAVLGGGGLAGVVKAGAVVATTATVAVGAGSAALDQDRDPARDRRPDRPAVATRPMPPAALPAPGGSQRAVGTTAERSASTSPAPDRARRRRAREPRPQQRADVAEVAELGTVEEAPAAAVASTAAPAPSTPSSASSAPAPSAGEHGTEAFLP